MCCHAPSLQRPRWGRNQTNSRVLRELRITNSPTLDILRTELHSIAIMSRITRAKAAEVAEKMHIDEDALLKLNSHDRKDILLQSTSDDRAPLCEVSPNSASSRNDAEAQLVQTTPEKKVKKRGRKGKKTNNTLSASTASAAPEDDEADVIPDEIQAAQSPASQAASDDLVKDIPECEL